jgi:TolB-like protein
MKRCSECGRDYNDDSLSFCLDDGAELLFGPVSTGEMRTAILRSGEGSSEDPTRLQISPTVEKSTSAISTRKWLILAAGAVLVIAGAFFGFRMFSRNESGSLLPGRFEQPSSERINSIAILPLKPLDASDNYLGMGIADAIIRRISQTGELTVRPTSAIRRYLNDDTDALTAAKQLNTEAVLEGSIQRSEDRIRVSVNLLRVSDGASLWNDSFDLRTSDIFVVQDTVSQQIATRLSLKLDPSRQADLTKHYTSNPTAYEYYQKAIYAFDRREDYNRERALATIDLFKKAIESDPNFALAHAQLAYAYAELATFSDPTNPKWAELVTVENAAAAALDPNLAEIHLARSLIFWSSYGGFQTKAAIRELLEAQRLNPNIGHAELAALYAHVGLEKLADSELQRASEIDPTSDFLKAQILNKRWLLGAYEDWLAETRRQYGDNAGHPEKALWYLLGTRRIEDARKQLAETSAEDSRKQEIRSARAILFALSGNYRAAENEIPGILDSHPVQNPTYHHATFDIATIYALEGKGAEAVKWLRKTAEGGYPCYPRFQHDAYFDRIKQTPEYVQFIAEMKSEWETYETEFARTNDLRDTE